MLDFGKGTRANCSVFRLISIQSIPSSITLTNNAYSLQNVKWFNGSGKLLETLQRGIERNHPCLGIITPKDKKNHKEEGGDREGIEISPSASQLIIADGSLVKSPIDFQPILERCVHLRSIVIGNNCLKETSTLIISASPCLRTLRVGENSFTCSKTEIQDQLTIQYCRFLTSIAIGKGSFRNVKTVSFMNLPQLVTVEMEATAFQNCSEFSLVGCQLLSELSFEKNSFPCIAKLCIQSGKTS